MFRAARHHRRSVRLRGFDYASPGAYFVTICTRDRARLFGEVVNGVMRASAAGEIVRTCWLAIADHFLNVQPDAWVLMPDHVHGILCLVDHTPAVGARHAFFVGARHAVPLRATERFSHPVAGSIPTIVRSFKSAVTCRINDLRGTPGAAVWQRGYLERVIRDDAELQRTRRYVAENPSRWGTGDE